MENKIFTSYKEFIELPETQNKIKETCDLIINSEDKLFTTSPNCVLPQFSDVLSYWISLIPNEKRDQAIRLGVDPNFTALMKYDDTQKSFAMKVLGNLSGNKRFERIREAAKIVMEELLVNN